MTEYQDTLQIWWSQAEEYYNSDEWTIEEKLRLLKFQEGAFWGYAVAIQDPILMARAFRLREQVADMLKEFAAE